MCFNAKCGWDGDDCGLTKLGLRAGCADDCLPSRLDNEIAPFGSDVYEAKRCEVHGVGAPPIESQTGAGLEAHVVTNGLRDALIGER